jgi:hypothetical protein
MANDRTPSDPGVAAYMDPVTYQGSRPHVHGITDHYPVADAGPSVDPGAASNPASPAHLGARLNIGSGTDEGRLVHLGATADQAAAIRVPAVADDPAGVVFDCFDFPGHYLPVSPAQPVAADTRY